VIEERGRNRVLVGVAWVAASLLMVVFLPSFAVASRLTARSCKPGGSHTLLATRTLRVYRTRTSGRGEAASDLIVACWLASARKTVLVTESPQYENNDVRLTAVKAAPGSTSVIGVLSSTVGVGLLETDLLQAFNVRSGRRLNSNEAELLSCEEGCDVSVLSFVVAPSGAFAFLGDVRAASTERPMGLYTIPVGHSLHLLEYGTPPQRPEPGVPTISDLAYANGLVSWSSNGSPMTAPIS
jgi:hypothetical protein